MESVHMIDKTVKYKRLTWRVRPQEKRTNVGKVSMQYISTYDKNLQMESPKFSGRAKWQSIAFKEKEEAHRNNSGAVRSCKLSGKNPDPSGVGSSPGQYKTCRINPEDDCNKIRSFPSAHASALTHNAAQGV